MAAGVRAIDEFAVWRPRKSAEAVLTGGTGGDLPNTAGIAIGSDPEVDDSIRPYRCQGTGVRRHGYICIAIQVVSHTVCLITRPGQIVDLGWVSQLLWEGHKKAVIIPKPSNSRSR